MVFMTVGCAVQQEQDMETVTHVNLERFMGEWYIIANIPTFIEKGAFNPVESYEQNSDGTISTTFTFRKSLEGSKKEYRAKGFITENTNNAIWGMQFVWPIKADYRVVYLDQDYEYTIIGRKKRDYLWIMARNFPISATKYEELLEIAVNLGYDKHRVIPTSWQVTPQEDI